MFVKDAIVIQIPKKSVYGNKIQLYLFLLYYNSKIPGYKIDGKISLTAHKICFTCGEERN